MPSHNRPDSPVLDNFVWKPPSVDQLKHLNFGMGGTGRAIPEVVPIKPNSKILVISIDDFDNPRMNRLLSYLRHQKVPVTVFPHRRANINNLNTISDLGWEMGRHGHGLLYDNRGEVVRTSAGSYKIHGLLDPDPFPGTNWNVVAWTGGKDHENHQSRLHPGRCIARGVRAGINKVGEFNPRDLNSVSLTNNPHNLMFMERLSNQVLQEGGILSIHAHNDHGVDSHIFKRMVAQFKTQGRVLFLKDLIGYGGSVRPVGQ